MKLLLFLSLILGFSELRAQGTPYVPWRPERFKKITETSFNRTLKKVQDFYTPIFRDQKKNLVIQNLWQSDDCDINSMQIKSESLITVRGGLSRIPQADDDALLMILCHEVGHFLGGHPKSKEDKFKWASAEGQADYFASAKCMKLVLKNDPQNEAKASKLDLPLEIKKLCEKQFPDRDDFNICIISAKASENVGHIANFIRGRSATAFNLTTPDPTVVRFSTNEYYPTQTQCRVDTILQGALCNTDPSIPMSDHNENVGACSRSNGDELGSRPRCWFKPSGYIF